MPSFEQFSQAPITSGRIFAGNEDKLPADSHFLYPLIVPRPVLMSTATEDAVESSWAVEQVYRSVQPVYAMPGAASNLVLRYRRGGHTSNDDATLVALFTTAIDDRVELYNLSDDPGEQRDLAAALPEKVARLRLRLHKWRTSLNAQLPERNPDYDPSKPRYRDPSRAPQSWQSQINPNEKGN
ncbi:MAG: hypothetical protein ACUVQG_03140 [Thermogutta sp.]